MENFATDRPDMPDDGELVSAAHITGIPGTVMPAGPVVMGVDMAGPAGEHIAIPGQETAARLFRSPDDTRGWVPLRLAGVECWRDHQGHVWTRAKPGEVVEARVVFIRIRGMGPMDLVSTNGSSAIEASERKEKRAARELSKRGY